MSKADFTPWAWRRVKGHLGIQTCRDSAGDTRYRYSYTEQGRPRFKALPSGATLTECKAAMEAMRTECRREDEERARRVKAGLPADPKPAIEIPTFEVMAQRWIKRQTAWKPRTLEKVQYVLRRFVIPEIGHLPVDEIKPDTVADLVASLIKGTAERKPLAGSTVRTIMQSVSGTMSYAVRLELAASNPYAALEPSERPKTKPKPKRALPAEDLWKIVNAASNDYKTVIAVMAFQGLRVGEACALTWGDVDFERGILRVEKTLCRNARRREDPKSERSKRELDHRALDRRGLQPAIKAAGLHDPSKPKITPHTLRHSYGSNMIGAGAELPDVSRQLGHASPEFTARVYLHDFGRAARTERTQRLMQEAFGG